MRTPFPTIRGQHGLATTPQLLDAGWTRSALHHLATHSGRQVHRGVYTDHHGTLTADQLLVAAWLWAGPDAVLTSMAALARHGLAVGSVRGVRFLTGTGRARRLRGVSVVRTTRVPHARLLDGLPTVSVERALADAARFADVPAERARALTIAALQDGLTSADRLTEELRAGRPNGTLPIRLGLDDFTRGAWSLPEVWLERAIRRRHPESIFLANPWLYGLDGELIGVPDGYLPQHGVAVQVHSRTHHSGRDAAGADRWAETVERDSAYGVHGLGLLQVTPTTLQFRPDQFLDRLDAVLSNQAGRPLPQVDIRDAVLRDHDHRRSA